MPYCNNMKNNWNEITVGEFIQLEQLLKSDIPESYRTVNVVALLDNKTIDEIESLPAAEFVKLARQLEFIQSQPKAKDVKKSYLINNRHYTLKADLTQITTAQYIDYQNYMKEETKDITKLLSVWLIPRGNEYNDGYDIQEVMKDIDNMLLEDAMGISFFFPKQLAAYMLILKDSLSNNLTMLGMEKKQIEEVETLCNNMASSLWCSASVNPQTLRLSMY